MDEREAIEVAAVHSAAGLLREGGLPRRRPFRAPHHTISEVALVGGGTPPRPGELSLAHAGVLFLDELPEFRRPALEALRQPLEDGCVKLARAAWSTSLPARVILVGAMNPCPCGTYGVPRARTCTCPPGAIERYRARVSGPLLDRIDLHVRVQPVDYQDLVGARGEDTATVRARVGRARAAQAERLAPLGIASNALIPPGAIERVCALPAEAGRLIERAVRQLALSARAVDRIRRVARTVADLAGDQELRAEHVLQALSLRELDRPP